MSSEKLKSGPRHGRSRLENGSVSSWRPTTMKFSEPMHEILDRIADSEGISKAQVIRRAIREFAHRWTIQ